jgi:hypothetical protein
MQNKSPEKNRDEEQRSMSGAFTKPERQSGSKLSAILLVVGGLVVVAVILFVALRGFSPSTSNGQTPSTSTPQAQSTPATKGDNQGGTLFDTNYPPAYWQTVKSEMAAGMHLSVEQLSTKLHQVWGGSSGGTGKSNTNGNPGDAVVQIATQQGLSADQLKTLELSSVQKGLDQMVSQGVITQDQANINLANLRDHSDPNGYIASVFMSH